jgi:hypothetical protein
LILLVVPRVGAASSNDVRASFEFTFAEVKKAEQSGGDVSALLPRLNLALQLINSGSEKDLQSAQIIIESVSLSAQIAQASGIQPRGAQYTIIGSSLVILSASAVLIYIYSEPLFWAVWAWTKRNWVVKNK